MKRLTKEFELTPTEQKKIMPLLLEHRQRIQALFDRHPSPPKRSQIRAISDDTHHEIEALLTDHQRQLAKAVQARMHCDAKPSSSSPVGQ